MKLYKAMIAVFLLSSSSVFAAGPSQPVYSLTNQGQHTNANGEPYQRVMVKCNNHAQQRYINRLVGDQQWCAYGLSDKCSSDRIEAASFACLLSSAEVDLIKTGSNLIAQLDSAALEQRQSLQSELLQLEQEKLQVQQRQLDLRKREVELVSRLDEL